jgi:hypothetical protein
LLFELFLAKEAPPADIADIISHLSTISNSWLIQVSCGRVWAQPDRLAVSERFFVAAAVVFKRYFQFTLKPHWRIIGGAFFPLLITLTW